MMNMIGSNENVAIPLRARGQKVPFGGSYPGKAGEVTTGKFVTTIVSHKSRLSTPVWLAAGTQLKRQPDI